LFDFETRLTIFKNKTIVLAPDIAHEDGVGMNFAEEVFIQMIANKLAHFLSLFAKELEGVMDLA
jgi:hypothetical protein